MGHEGKKVVKGRARPLADQVLRKIGEARELYHRLILMVDPAGGGKTSALQEVSTSTSAPLINVNLELSRRMLELTERQRALQLPRLLGEIMGEHMTYAVPDHPEYRRYPIRDFLVVSPDLPGGRQG
ncbi:MAG TPA: BREX-3 system P-loop-containing protein BrxF [Candidatus Fraserbacteria bacterium]|nr:BREX-3 system P-loop-containing protein BrxF [Candidatus Fraserbacteria bacterium]